MKFRFALLALLALAACGQPASTPPPAEPAAEAVFDPAAGVSVQAPLANARVASPLVTTGAAPDFWFFEEQFYGELIGTDGASIVQFPVMRQADGSFRGEAAFNVAADTPATLLLREDMPEEGSDRVAQGATPRPTSELRIPIVLTP